LGTFWLKIKQFWPFEETSIFSNGGHLGWRAWLSDIFLKGTDTGTITADQNCSILSQNVPIFELYQHNADLFNIYYGFFMNFEVLPIFTNYAN
jgi:hypothetical protein